MFAVVLENIFVDASGDDLSPVESFPVARVGQTLICGLEADVAFPVAHTSEFLGERHAELAQLLRARVRLIGDLNRAGPAVREAGREQLRITAIHGNHHGVEYVGRHGDGAGQLHDDCCVHTPCL